MLWNDLSKRIDMAMKNFEIMKADILVKRKEDERFLSGSYLVLCNRFGQVNLKDFEMNPKESILKMPFLIGGKLRGNVDFINLFQVIKRLEAKSGRFKGQTEEKQLKQELQETKRELAAFDLTSLDFKNDLLIEIRFPTVRMSTIQELKNHPLADSKMTEMREFSIRVVVSCGG
jgi:hypothetical protein